jgi:SAM-dependent methyltransferase
MSRLGRLFPEPVKRELKRALPYYRRFYCPVCDHWDRAFQTFGLIPRANARCPTCGALERHRLIWHFFKHHTDLLRPPRKRMLHFAPEPMFAARLARLPHLDYLTADLYGPAMAKVDITDMPFEDRSFDVLYCSHVLEHVPDDRRALRECYRVLKSGGWAAFIVPIFREPTVEDPSITDPCERERLFGQVDHVRKYGPDFQDRLKEAGFAVSRYSADEIGGRDWVRCGIPRHEGPIFWCRRAE